MNKQDLRAFYEEFQRIQENPIYFMIEYWNRLHPDRKLDLTADEKEEVYKRTCSYVPCLDNEQDLHEYMRQYEEAKKKGLKDWQRFYPGNMYKT